MRCKAQAPAKINLTLDIMRRRPDGYHEVDMLMQSVSLYENVTLEADPLWQGECGNITITCNKEGVPCDSTNIAYKAAKAFFDYVGISAHSDIAIHIEKQIPFGAGLAGGSADGAAVIVILNRIYDKHLKETELCEIGARVGADVPFCIVGGTRRATGIGTTFSKVPKLSKCYIVICKPEISISTAKAYALADSRTGAKFSYTDLCAKALYSGSVRNVSDFLHNDFEEVLSLDVINSIKETMLKSKALGAAMSGSGSAVFGLFLTKSKAEKCAELLRGEYEDVYVVKPVNEGVIITEIPFSE
ncbi:MAG: 4-(cytidine 5'-diphospho)-2-C-methyl-D-erythritol kinase [Ruminococcus sp.]|nr:4-(cytidine 5'-diphospho)-2-C-methyl-D-erythritol kinase [Ruminococcus sp.]